MVWILYSFCILSCVVVETATLPDTSSSFLDFLSSLVKNTTSPIKARRRRLGGHSANSRGARGLSAAKHGAGKLSRHGRVSKDDSGVTSKASTNEDLGTMSMPKWKQDMLRNKTKNAWQTWIKDPPKDRERPGRAPADSGDVWRECGGMPRLNDDSPPSRGSLPRQVSHPSIILHAPFILTGYYLTSFRDRRPAFTSTRTPSSTRPTSSSATRS